MADKLVPVWESHMAERDARYNGGAPHWYLSTRYVYRLRFEPAYAEYVIEDFQKHIYYTHEDVWRGIADAD
jgi:hypothetical protein